MKVPLQLVQPEPGKDAVISVTANGFPILKGTEVTHPSCGHCGSVLAWNLSLDTIRSMVSTVHRLIYRCACGQCNLVSSRSSLTHGLQSAFGVPDDEVPGIADRLNDLERASPFGKIVMASAR